MTALLGLLASLAAAAIPFNDPGHKPFFNYHLYLAAQALEAETPETWAKKSSEDQLKAIALTEKHLKRKLEEVIANPGLIERKDVEELIRAVWGDAVLDSLRKLSKAYITKDPKQVQHAAERTKESIKTMAGKLAGVSLDDFFDGAVDKGRELAEVDEPAAKDFLKPEPESSFLQELKSPLVLKHLESREKFEKFLKNYGVPARTVPHFSSLYQLVSRASDQERADLSHIMPTLVKFILDKKPVKDFGDDNRGTNAFVIRGPYDQATELSINRKLLDFDPAATPTTLGHEIEHIYDFYVGRPGTLDMELRGFKVGVLLYEILAREAPEKLKQLENSNNDDLRRFMEDKRKAASEYRIGTREFGQRIANGHRYVKEDSGWFHGRRSLRETLREPEIQESGPIHQLASSKRQLELARADEASASQKHTNLLKALEGKESRRLQNDLEKASNDLRVARARVAHYEHEVAIKALRLSRLRANLEWLNRTKGESEPYDLSLQVDEDFFKP
ncbi:MAG: hypothetical protein HY549_07680 [Elusimicrobia bacterium]|nr:hypothetical protein [Elusimicrobiota bacterium]